MIDNFFALIWFIKTNEYNDSEILRLIEENITPHNWKNPVWHHEDGSVAEW